MRFARIRTPEGPAYVRLEDDVAMVLRAPPWRDFAATAVGGSMPWRPEDLLCPVEPSKIVCVGRNYALHAKELGNDVPSEPLLFLKPPSSLLDPNGTILLPPESRQVEHECELAIVIGARTHRVPREQAKSYVMGFAVANDVTARDLQKKDGQFTRAKGFDTFCPVGPWIDTEMDPSRVRLLCRVNGATRQDGLTTQMIFDVPTLIAYISNVMTLEPGDLILTGTPDGVGPLLPGDVCEVELCEPESGASLALVRSDVRAV